MDTNKRALTALVMIIVITFSACGVVGLTATKASAATCLWVTKPTTGKAGEELPLSVKIENSVNAWFILKKGTRESSGWGRNTAIDGQFDLSAVTLPGDFIEAGQSTVQVKAIKKGGFYPRDEVSQDGCSAYTLTILGDTAPKLELQGPSTGIAGDTLKFDVFASDCDVNNVCHGVATTGNIGYGLSPIPYSTGSDGHAYGVQVPFTKTGSYNVAAYDGGRPVTSNTIPVTITAAASPAASPAASTGGQTPVSSATPTAKMNETALALESAAGAASSPMGALWWILGIGAFILLAIFAAVLLLRRREGDEEDEGDVDNDY